MRREPLKFLLFGVIGLLIAVELWLLVSGNRILLNEEYFPEHEGSGVSFYVPAEEAKYGCTYFTGRKQVNETVSSDQYDECPFIWTESK